MSLHDFSDSMFARLQESIIEGINHGEYLSSSTVKIGLPGGHSLDRTINFLSWYGGIVFSRKERSYHPRDQRISTLDFRIFKARDIPPLVRGGYLSGGFVGYDLAIEERSEQDISFELTGINPCSVVVASNIPTFPTLPFRVATEFPNLAESYLSRKGLEKNKDYTLVLTHGTTEAYVPDLADIIIDHHSTGKTLKENGLQVLDTIMQSHLALLDSPSLLAATDSSQYRLYSRFRKWIKETYRESERRDFIF
ncbi:MAG: ATP phosphoribosyltransferase [Candidatus Woesearchaeota archaeon]